MTDNHTQRPVDVFFTQRWLEMWVLHKLLFLHKHNLTMLFRSHIDKLTIKFYLNLSILCSNHISNQRCVKRTFAGLCVHYLKSLPFWPIESLPFYPPYFIEVCAMLSWEQFTTFIGNVKWTNWIPETRYSNDMMSLTIAQIMIVNHWIFFLFWLRKIKFPVVHELKRK